MVNSVQAGVCSDEPLSNDPPIFRKAFELLPPLRDALVQEGGMRWQRLGSVNSVGPLGPTPAHIPDTGPRPVS